MMPLRLAIACILLLVAGRAFADLKVYDVDFKYRREVFEALQQVLQAPPVEGRPEISTGRVQLLPSGQILVETTPQTHAEIAAVLEAIAARQVEPAPRATLRYWVVLGTAGPNGIGTEPPGALADVLREFEAVQGDRDFSVLATATLSTESGQEGRVEGELLDIEQRVLVQDAALNAEIKIEFEYRVRAPIRERDTGMEKVGEIELDVTMNRGESVVLAQNSVARESLDGALLYVVQWIDD